MKHYLAGLAGLATVVAVLVIVGLVAVWFGYVPAAADAPPPFAIERWAAKRALNATITREMPRPPYPFGPATDATILAGRPSKYLPAAANAIWHQPHGD